MWLGLNEYAGPYLMGIVLFAVAAFMVDRTLRPDPLEVIGGLLPPDADAQRGSAPSGRSSCEPGSVSARSSYSLARLAMVSMLVGQAVMVGVMTATPLHMKSGAHEIRGSASSSRCTSSGCTSCRPSSDGWSIVSVHVLSSPPAA
ncbi:MAG: hypothetical protein R2710_05380 [Acidimicrobiales bacterium]